MANTTAGRNYCTVLVCFRGNQRQLLRCADTHSARSSGLRARSVAEKAHWAGPLRCGAGKTAFLCTWALQAPSRPRHCQHHHNWPCSVSEPGKCAAGALGGWPHGSHRAQMGFWSLSVSYVISQVLEFYDVHNMKPKLENNSQKRCPMQNC